MGAINWTREEIEARDRRHTALCGEINARMAAHRDHGRVISEAEVPIGTAPRAPDGPEQWFGPPGRRTTALLEALYQARARRRVARWDQTLSGSDDAVAVS